MLASSSYRGVDTGLIRADMSLHISRGVPGIDADPVSGSVTVGTVVIRPKRSIASGELWKQSTGQK